MGVHHVMGINRVMALIMPSLSSPVPPKTQFPCLTASEQEFQSELNQSRIRPRGRGRDHSEILIVGRAANCVRWSELSSVENVKELSAELKAKPLVGREPRHFEQREIKIVNPSGTQPRIDTRLVPKRKVSGRCKACCIKPSRNAKSIRIATGDEVRT